MHILNLVMHDLILILFNIVFIYFCFLLGIYTFFLIENNFSWLWVCTFVPSFYFHIFSPRPSGMMCGFFTHIHRYTYNGCLQSPGWLSNLGTLCLIWWLWDEVMSTRALVPLNSTAQKTTIHQVTTMLATSTNVLFPGYKQLLTTGADDSLVLRWWSKCRSSAPVVSRWLWPGNRTFLEVISIVVTWWIVAVLPSAT